MFCRAGGQRSQAKGANGTLGYASEVASKRRHGGSMQHVDARDGSSAPPQAQQPLQIRAPMTHEHLEASLYHAHHSTNSHNPNAMYG